MATSRFDRILVANRGEIACRVIRACRELGRSAVAVYSDADRDALHVSLADSAVRLGPAPAKDSYLSIPLILSAARASGAQAIHPGYGFLSENAEFAAACKREGIAFIGPSPEAITLLGNKVEARALASTVDVPTLPGTPQPVASGAEARRQASRIGYPVLLKAAAGGGGKGMRLVRDERQMDESFARASSEAESAFKDPSVYVEKYLDGPRHIEIQVMADQAGHVLTLGERECSVQRRHQKIVEESPSTHVTQALRESMYAAARRLVMAASYHGAGTVEFLVDADRNFYFLEVNTRLQVEHPVTEAVTGLDLVKLQIAVAEGHPLPLTQADVRLAGHAIECRVYAEDPSRNFAPCPGPLTVYRRHPSPGVREDTGVREGALITPHYDPMISKIIAWGATRDEAIERMRAALAGTTIIGIETTVSYLLRLLDLPAFRQGDTTTDFVDRHQDALAAPLDDDLLEALAIGAAVERTLQARRGRLPEPVDDGDAWARPGRAPGAAGLSRIPD